MERDDLPAEALARAHSDLTRLHRYLGNTAALVHALRRDPLPVARVLDVGCGHGGLLLEIRRRLGVAVAGVDLRPPENPRAPILHADATRDPLPAADVAISVCFAHHLTDAALIAVIRNAGRSCRRFVILDLVRHPVPLALFTLFVGPFLSPVNRADGALSIRRAFTPAELRAVAVEALDGGPATFRHAVAPLGVRQILDISYGPVVSGRPDASS